MKARDSLLVMTRLPRLGGNKTRLIPALGPQGATDFHDRLARHAVGRASSYALMHPGTRLRVHLEGGSPQEGRSWLGEVDCRPQESGDLGERLHAAVESAFSEGARRVVVIGTDCPSLDEPLLAEAFASLAAADLVFGPAEDGGYYLVGLSRPCPAIFRGIAWGGPQVLEQSLAAARESGFHAALLATRADVDTPADLPAARSILEEAATLSVIIPTLNEGAGLGKLLERVGKSQPHEILVADGGSTDSTVSIAEQMGARIITTSAGRGRQLNLAASMATGEFLLFLHADTLPPDDYPRVIERVLQRAFTSAGAFRFQLSGELPAAPLIEAFVHLRCRLKGTPYGDQGLFVRRRIFHHLGGYPDWPVLEDLQMVRQLIRLGPVRIAPEVAVTSARRWETGGTLWTFLRHQLVLAAFHVGVPPRHLGRIRL